MDARVQLPDRCSLPAFGPDAPERKLNILWLSHFVPYPPKGGAFQRSYCLLREAARRHSVVLVALNQRALLPTRAALNEAMEALSRIGAEVVVFDNPSARSHFHKLATAVLSLLHEEPYELTWLHSRLVHAYLRRLAASRRFDAVHVDTLGLMPYARWFPETPVVLNHHDVESHLAERRAQGERNVLRRAYLVREAVKIERLELELCPQAAINLVVSDLDAERLRRAVPSARAMAVDNGVDVEYFRPGVSGSPEEGGLVFAGSLNLYPNRDAVRHFLADIWPALLADDPARRITLVGRTPPPEVIKATRDPRVKAPGWVDDVRPYLDAASIYVCPVRNGGGTRLKVLDALAMAKPLVATALAVEGLDLVDEQHYLRAETPQEYVAQVSRLEADTGLRRRLGEAGRRFVVGRYAWDVIGEKLDQSYRFAVSGNGAGGGHR